MINKEKYDNEIITYYGLPENTTVVYYQNPKLFFKKYLEMINPTHIGILWGVKHVGNTRNYIRYGKIILPSVLLSEYLFLGDFITGFIFSSFIVCYTWYCILRLNHAYRDTGRFR